MGVDKGVAGAAVFASPVLCVGTACSTNKIRGQRSEKMCQKKKRQTKFVLKKTPWNARNCTIFFSIIFHAPHPSVRLCISIYTPTPAYASVYRYRNLTATCIGPSNVTLESRPMISMILIINIKPKTEQSKDIVKKKVLKKETGCHHSRFLSVYSNTVLLHMAIDNTDPYSYQSRGKGLLKTSLEKEKMFVISIFFLSHNLSYH